MLGSDFRVNFFKGITIFCWVVVILLQIVFTFSINKNRHYVRKPSYCTLVVSINVLLVNSQTVFAVLSWQGFLLYRFHGFYKIDRVVNTRFCVRKIKAVLSAAVISSVLVLQYDLVFFFQSLGIQVILTILLIACTASISIRLVDLNKLNRDSFGSSKVPGTTTALLFAATVSEFHLS